MTTSVQLTPEQETILQGFNRLRNDQRNIAIKATELEADIKEHDIDSARKCFRQIGGVLVERTVGEVLPALIEHKDNIVKLVLKLTEELESKGKEISNYQTKHKIHITTLDKESLQSIPNKQDDKSKK